MKNGHGSGHGISKLFKGHAADRGPEVDHVEVQIRAAAIAEGFLDEAASREQRWLVKAWPGIGPLVVAFAPVSASQLLLLLLLIAETIGHDSSALAMAHLWKVMQAWPWLAGRIALAALHEGDFETPDHRTTWLLYRAIREVEGGDDGKPWQAFGAALASLMEAEALRELMLIMAARDEVDEPEARGCALARSLSRLVDALAQARQVDPWKEPGVLVGLRRLALRLEPGDGFLVAEGPALLAALEKARVEGCASRLVGDDGDGDGGARPFASTGRPEGEEVDHG